MAKGEIKQEIIGLVKLISFFKQLRHKTTLKEVGFFFANDLFNLVKYRQCIVWLYDGKKIKLLCASGQLDTSADSPLAEFLSKLLKKRIAEEGFDVPEEKNEDEEPEFVKFEATSFSDYKDLSEDEIKEFISPHISNIYLYDQQRLLGGVWINNTSPFSEIEEAIIVDASDALAAQLAQLQAKKRLPMQSLKVSKIIILIALFTFLLWPVRFSSTGTAEIIAENVDIVSVPFNGLVKDVFVDPNQSISEGDLLLSLDKTELQNNYNVAVQKLETAQQKLAKTEREAFQDHSKNAEINILRQEIKLAELDVAFTRERLNMSDITAPRDGIALFSDKNDLIGQPTQAGQKVMIVADKNDLELLIRIPVKAMIDVNEDIDAKFFLNVAPLESHTAQIYNISYQPTVDPDGLMTYKARAKLKDADNIGDVGLSGTAKIFGDRTIMLFNLLRRPFIALRNLSSF
ncbi:MAG: HlyD family efflux transporter periplasmic adaptor subunit [Pseudomonadota bacterium]